MGNYTHCVVDRETDSPEDAERLGQQIIAWMVELEIIQDRLSDCGLGEPGYPPSPHYWRACSTPEHNFPGPGDDGFLTLGWNGVQLYTQRHPFFIAQGDFGPPHCPHCEAENDIDSYYHACDEWLKGSIGDLCCDECGVATPVSRWEHDSLLCGTLGMVFWNWPGLSPGFLRELSERIGRRMSVIEGKI